MVVSTCIFSSTRASLKSFWCWRSWKRRVAYRILLTHCKYSPSLQRDLLKGIVDLLTKIDQERQGSKSCAFVIKVKSVKGWSMTNPNNVCLVYDSNGGSDPRTGSVRSTKDFGIVPLRTKATSPTVQGISLMVSSACDVFVQVDGVFFFLYILTIPFVISCIRTSKIWNLLSHLHLETQSTHTHDNYWRQKPFKGWTYPFIIDCKPFKINFHFLLPDYNHPTTTIWRSSIQNVLISPS